MRFNPTVGVRIFRFLDFGFWGLGVLGVLGVWGVLGFRGLRVKHVLTRALLACAPRAVRTSHPPRFPRQTGRYRRTMAAFDTEKDKEKEQEQEQEQEKGKEQEKEQEQEQERGKEEKRKKRKKGEKKREGKKRKKREFQCCGDIVCQLTISAKFDSNSMRKNNICK